MHSKDILIAFLTYFLSWIIFEPDDFILDQCVLGTCLDTRFLKIGPLSQKLHLDPKLKAYF